MVSQPCFIVYIKCYSSLLSYLTGLAMANFLYTPKEQGSDPFKDTFSDSPKEAQHPKRKRPLFECRWSRVFAF